MHAEKIGRTLTSGLGLGVSLIALAAGLAGTAQAGGFAIREQSTTSQGASFAGNAAGVGLSSMFWNNAATAMQGGLNLESHYALIIPDAEVTVQSIGGFPVSAVLPGVDPSAQIAELALVPSTYLTYQFANFDPNLFMGLSINSPFGLATKPDNNNYAGSVLGRTSSLFTTNLNPNIAYRIAPGVMIGVGAQFQYNNGVFKFATGSPTGPNTFFEGDALSVGATAGILWQPSASTSIGLGWRSAMDAELQGRFATNPGVNPALVGGVSSSVDLKLPDIVTLSMMQAVSPTFRVMGTVEWSNWSRFKELRVVADGPGLAASVPGFVTAPGQTIATIEADWSDGWFFSLGGEYDVSPAMTLRAGVAYELSPVDAAEKRIIGIPDSDRIWLSIGGSYRMSETMSLDLAYTHIFLDEADFVRTPVGGTAALGGTVDASTDIISVAIKTKFGGEKPLK